MSQDINIQNLRKNYQTQILEKQSIPDNPFTLFKSWFGEVSTANLLEPNAMSLSTSNKHGFVSSRMVLLKAYDDEGFVFFTNYNSQKAQDIRENNKVALTFWWDKLYRQVRVSGKAEKVTREESIEYFHSRPLGSQLGALTSNQSEVIRSYAVLEAEYERLEAMYKDQEVPCPDHWGGYRVVPKHIEFWQGRPNRLHDRLCYMQESLNNWKVERLSP